MSAARKLVQIDADELAELRAKALRWDALHAAPRDREVTIPRVIAVVAKHFGYFPEAITGESRIKTVVHARHLAMWIARSMVIPRPSFPELGIAFYCDHTTVVSAVQKVERANPITDPTIQALVAKVRELELQP